jgi:hypothetical protein
VTCVCDDLKFGQKKNCNYDQYDSFANIPDAKKIAKLRFFCNTDEYCANSCTLIEAINYLRIPGGDKKIASKDI